ncbi:hypothetical protein ABIC45_002952 [Mucilaginibacter rubeus]|uniref:hypothetical protein n=1 Tax=Mucilaginibacter rubeus TaxID=2027860 RepID=UPI003398AB52
MNNTSIKVLIDPSANRSPFTDKAFAIELDKGELFKYAVWMFEIPKHIKESDFDYLQSKVPSLEHLYTDYIQLKGDAIVNICTDDRTKQMISEMIGIGVGLKYATLLLTINPNQFKKIGVPDEGKYLDYSVIKEQKEYEIETKGTTGDYYSVMKNDIIAKKKDQPKSVYLRFGTITLLQKDGGSRESQCVVVDDPPDDNNVAIEDAYQTALLYYATYFSYILDSKYYNRFIAPLLRGQGRWSKIQPNKFFGRYHFKDRTYYGECFDYRLIKENVLSVRTEGRVTDRDFQALTQRVGRTKFFFGVDQTIIQAINRGNRNLLATYNSPKFFEDGDNLYRFLDTDGILIIKSRNGSDGQLEQIFSEDVVRERLGLYEQYLRGEAHLCGAPCRSRGIEGKPCERRTFRRFCFFHR